eukprot:TRINITY_DN14045_c0_g1_i1.p1 TRINITY_DN14045_c0_g1~~TRINITY_DN14045_c0_g1_i1.p1  ORF type:complete len:328 (+),score=64.44 TRINITY_DN14045_c0_g1_i1:125-1108(+)
MALSGRVFVTRELTPNVMARLKREVTEVRCNPDDRVLSRSELLDGIRWCDCAITQLTDKIDEEVFSANPSLKLIANFAVGFNNVDTEAATAHKVPVSNTPGVLTETTADLTFALLLAVSRRIVESDHYMRTGQYKSWAPQLLLGQDVFGKTIGIVGFGRIGYAVAKRAFGFSMKIIYTDIDEKPYAAEFNAKRVDMETLLRESDFVTLHPFLDSASTHLIGEAELRSMKPTSYLLNASRGPVMDEAALVRACKEGWIAGAGLDVFEREPKMAPGLAELPNVVIVPHIGSATIETRDAMGNLAVDNVVARLKGTALPSCVNPKVLASL